MATPKDSAEGFDDLNASDIRQQAVRSMFSMFESLCEGALIVDKYARIVWMDDKYRNLLHIDKDKHIEGEVVSDIIPNSLMYKVLETGKPTLLDIMPFHDQYFVVTRIPLLDKDNRLIGAFAFVFYDSVQYLRPLVSKFERMQTELKEARQALAQHRAAKYTFTQFIGSSPSCLEVKRLARRAAQLDTTVLLLGETGTGKELLAHAIHSSSTRSDKPMVNLNVAAIPETLLEAEFFGVAPGAYTGAERKGRKGKFELADGGTLFLDEVGDMPLHLQPKLLRALQEQEIEPLGSNKVVKVNVRVIAATSRNLQQMVEEGEFRSDLYFRLNVLPITVPPLRERLQDIRILCDFIMEDIALRNGLPVKEVSPEAADILARYTWPGNVREFRNVLEQIYAITDKVMLTANDFRNILPLKNNATTSASVGSIQNPEEATIRPLDEIVAETERQAIEAALRETGGKKAPAAKLLKISRARLYDKMKSLKIPY